MSSVVEPLLEAATTAIVPRGYKLLVVMPDVKGKTTPGGLHIPEKSRDREATASMVAQVVAMGDEAYNDEHRFPNGPWCNVGDWVVFRSYAGTRIKHGEREFRLINDDTVEAVTYRPDELEKP